MISRVLKVGGMAAVLLAAAARSAAPAADRATRFTVPAVLAKLRMQGDGKALYLENCKSCHGVLGAPTKKALREYKKIPNFTEAGFFTRRSEDSVVTVLRKGLGDDMKSFSDKLSSEEMRAVAKYVRTLGKAP